MKNNLWILFACIIFVTIISSNELKKGTFSSESADSSFLNPVLVDSSSNDKADDLYNEINRHDSLFIEVAKENDVNWIWLKSIMIKESHGLGHFISSTGAVGLMQLMPRQGSYVDQNYRNYQASRKQKRQKDGLRYYKGKSEIYWATAYRKVLDSLQKKLPAEELYAVDKRFDPFWNIKDAGRQFAGDYHFFRNRKHGPYTSRILAFAAYNAGRYAVMKDRGNSELDRIPINRQTELYVANVERIFEELQQSAGQVNEANAWMLQL